MHPFHILLTLFVILCFVALGFLVRWERGVFIARGKRGAWLAARIATIPIALVTAALVIVPAVTTRGPEALAVFYLLLLILAPVFWFGIHWIVGRCTRPPLTFAESALIAGSPLLLGLAAVSLAHTLQPIAWSALRAMGRA